MTAYGEALRYLYGLAPRGIRLELDRIRAVLALRGDPHRDLRAVHVAGTNGKGSVATMIEGGLRRAGHRTGLFTSPHLHRFTERIRVGGRPVAEEAVARGVRSLRQTLEQPGAPELTFFESTTVLAFELFREAGCDAAVLEVGLGGRLDSTNVVESPELCVITRVALDHCERLGDTLAAVAREKAGILKRGVPAVVGAGDRQARRVVADRARRLEVPVRWLGQEVRVEAADGRRVTVRVGDRRVERVRVPFEGEHQRDNVALAVGALVTLDDRGWGIDDGSIRCGIARARWPGRMERLAGEPSFLLDAAHNPDGCAALGAHLDTLPPRRRVLVFGAMEDKDHQAMLAAFDGRVDRRIYAAPPLARATPTAHLARIRRGQRARDVATAVDRAARAAGPEGLVVVAGSIFLVAEARRHLLGVRADPPIGM